MSVASTITEHVIAVYLPGTPAGELDPAYDLLDNGVVDSLGLVQLVAWVGERYSIPVDELDISPENFRSVDAIRRLVEGVTGSASRAEGPK